MWNEQEEDMVPFYVVHRQKMKLIDEKIRAKLEAKYGKQMDELAAMVVDYVSTSEKAQENNEKRREELLQKASEILN